MNFMDIHTLGSLLQLNIYNNPNTLQIKAHQPGLPHATAKIILEETLDIILKMHFIVQRSKVISCEIYSLLPLCV